MKIKTATIRVNGIYGAPYELCADITYRGKLLYSFFGLNATEIANKAIKWSIAQGFNRYNISMG